MKISMNNITIRDVVNGYQDKGEDGVSGYGCLLDIRPPYQREFVYKDDQKKAVIDTIFKGFPLNVMYWVKNPDGRYEVLDGQQRTISFCSYVSGDFSVPDGNGNAIYFPNLPQDRKDAFLDYKLSIYICEGTDSEKLDWFRIVNIAGARLTDQELRNAVYAGPWLSDAKRYFSKNGCAAYQIGSRYMTGQPIRQDYLETALKWIVDSDEVKAKGISSIEEYMGRYQDERNANELWLYFKGVIDWVDTLFGTKHYRKEMDGLDWGILYNRYHDDKYDADTLETEVSRLMADEDVTSKKGIYAYVLGGLRKEDERLLSIRKFLERDKRSAYEKQDGICPKCGNHFEYKDMQADHIEPWSKGGRTIADNCQMLCAKCNREKTND